MERSIKAIQKNRTSKSVACADEDEGRYKLTEKAPEKAMKSYEEFYEKIDGYVE